MKTTEQILAYVEKMIQLGYVFQEVTMTNGCIPEQYAAFEARMSTLKQLKQFIESDE